jgi:hypothetical protein
MKSAVDRIAHLGQHHLDLKLGWRKSLEVNPNPDGFAIHQNGTTVPHARNVVVGFLEVDAVAVALDRVSRGIAVRGTRDRRAHDS